MTLIELIGFVITMAAFFFLIAKQVWDERKRRQNPEVYEEQERREQEAVKQLLRSLNVDVSEEEEQVHVEPPPPPPLEKVRAMMPMRKGGLKPFSEEVPLTDFKMSEVFRDPYAEMKLAGFEDAHVKRKQQQSCVKELLRKTDSLKDAVILKEVLGRPKGFE